MNHANSVLYNISLFSRTDRILSPLLQAHTAQGDSELDGTGIETSITGEFKISSISAADFEDWHAVIDFPLGETATDYIVHGFTET